jgi:hypothetical protein
MSAPTVRSVLEEVEGKRVKLLADIAASSRGPRGGTHPRGIQLEDEADGLAWLTWPQGRVDADFLLPKLAHNVMQLRFLGVDNVPHWTAEPQTEVQALEVIDKIIACCRAAIGCGGDAPAAINGKPLRTRTEGTVNERSLSASAVEALLTDSAPVVLKIVQSDRSADDKMRAIAAIDQRFFGWKSPQWAELLRVSDNAVRRTRFWTVDRKRYRERE